MQQSLFIVPDNRNTLGYAIRALATVQAPQTDLGRKLLAVPEGEWTPAERRLCWELMARVKARLLQLGIDYEKIPEPPRAADASPLVTAYKIPPQPKPEAQHNHKEIALWQGKFKITFPFDRSIVDLIKSVDCPGRYYYGGEKAWYVPLKKTALVILELLLGRHDFNISPEAAEVVRFLRQPGSRSLLPTRMGPQVDLSQFKGEIRPSHDGLKLALFFEHNEAVGRALFELGAKWNKTAKEYQIPKAMLWELKQLLPGFTVPADLQKWLPAPRPPRLAFTAPDLDKPFKNGWRLFQHQKEAIRSALQMPATIIAHHMGLMKTITSLVIAKTLSAGQIPIMVVCPPSLRLNWRIEADIVGVRVEMHSSGKIPAPPEYPYILIVDEAHYYCNYSSLRTQDMLLLSYSPNCYYAAYLTGTPMPNADPRNLYPLLRMCQHPVAKNKLFFEERYCQGKRGSNLDELNRRITRDNPSDPYAKRMMLVATKEQCLDLPAKTRVMRRVEVKGQALKDYNDTLVEAANDVAARIEKGDLDPNAEPFVMLTALRVATSMAKVDASVEIAREVLDSGEQLVIFTEFLDSARALKAELEEYGVGFITGDVNDKEVQQHKEKFQAGLLKLMICTFKRGGVGHTLTAASTVILHDRPWRPGDAEQGEDRLHRQGQRSAVTALWLQADLEGDLDAKIDDLLLRKTETIEMVIKGKRQVVKIDSMRDLAKQVARLRFGR